MKTTVLISIFILALVSCSENQPEPQIQLKPRTVENIGYFYDGVSTSVSYNSLTGEYEIYIAEDFEYRAYGETNWIPLSGNTHVKIKCRCTSSIGLNWQCTAKSTTTGGDSTFSCENNCDTGCSMRIKITNAAGAPIDEFDNGGEFRLQ